MGRHHLGMVVRADDQPWPDTPIRMGAGHSRRDGWTCRLAGFIGVMIQVDEPGMRECGRCGGGQGRYLVGRGRVVPVGHLGVADSDTIPTTCDYSEFGVEVDRGPSRKPGLKT